MTTRFARLLHYVMALCLALLACACATARDAGTLRIGYQKYGTLTILKALGSLDKALGEQGIAIKWVEFPAGPQLLEGLNVGSIDFGTVGEAPPIFAQAAGAPLVYVGNEPPAPESEAILVPHDSPIRSVADLRGKKVALNKGSNVHYLLVKHLEKAGVAYRDVQVAYLTPADARAAFERGSVDAWVIWDPYEAAAEASTGARILADGTGLVSNYQFYFSTKKFLEHDGKAADTVLEALKEVDEWTKNNIDKVAEQLSPSVGLPAPVLAVSLRRESYGIKPISDDVIASQQRIADTFLQLKLLPRAIKVSDIQRKPGT